MVPKRLGREVFSRVFGGNLRSAEKRHVFLCRYILAIAEGIWWQNGEYLRCKFSTNPTAFLLRPAQHA